MLDKKVLEVLVNRVEDSSYNYAIHKNEQWKDCLESDKDRLINYVMKYDKNTQYLTLQNLFRFTVGEDLKLIFTASKSSKNIFLITWHDDVGKYQEMYCKESGVIKQIECGHWIIVEKDIF